MIVNIDINEYGMIDYIVIKDNIMSTVDKSKLLKYLLEDSVYYSNIKIMNDTIIVKTYDYNLYIKNYSNNINPDLKRLIDNIKKIKVKERKEELRNKRVKRVKLITAAVVMSLSVNIISNFYDDEIIDNEYINDIPDDGISHSMMVDYQKIEEERIKEIKRNLENEDIAKVDYSVFESNDCNVYEIEYESRIDTEKFKTTKERYYQIIERQARKYGIDPQIILAIATQESGDHYTKQNPYAIGLMQLELSVWENNYIYGFNYETNEMEKVFITKEKLNEIEFNIKVACMYFQQCLKLSNGNLCVAIQMYNYGQGNMCKVLENYYKVDDFSFSWLDKNDVDWINYRYVVGNQGDPKYLENVLSYIENPNEIKCIKNNKLELESYKLKNKLIKS